MHPHVHKRIGLAIAAIIAFAALCCGVVAKRNTIIAYADRHILLENTNSGYCNLQNSKIEEKVLQTIFNGDSPNLARNTLSTRDYDQGFTITVHEDGSFTYSGTNNGGDDVYLTLNAGHAFQRSGDFIVSDTKELV